MASQSIDRLWAVTRQTTADGVGDGAYNAAAAARIATVPAHSIVTNNPAYFNFQSCNGTNFHFRVNNTMYPQWTSTKSQDWWQHTKLAVGDQGNMLAGALPVALKQYEDNFFVYACQLEHRTDGDERFVSGIDTRGAAAQCYFVSNQSALTDLNSGAAGTANIDRTGNIDNQVMVFAECTSLLRIMANKVLEIVQ